jgi:hypothetical protein
VSSPLRGRPNRFPAILTCLGDERIGQASQHFA